LAVRVRLPRGHDHHGRISHGIDQVEDAFQDRLGELERQEEYVARGESVGVPIDGCDVEFDAVAPDGRIRCRE
jgi:hypothetical protein